MQENNKKVIIIGAGFGGLSAAAYLSKNGFSVTVLERNSWTGGRAQVWKEKGFTFDMGPSWFWMPELYDAFFADFQYKTNDFYTLKRLNPSYKIYFEDEAIELPADKEQMIRLFESYEKGAGKKLAKLLRRTQNVYDVTLQAFIPRSYNSFSSFLNKDVLLAGAKLFAQYNGLQSVKKFLSSQFTNEKLLKILEFPIFFLGESSRNIPAVYCIMNHVDINVGTWHPVGGFGKVADAVAKVAVNQGAEILCNQEVTAIQPNSQTTTVKTKDGKMYEADIVLSNGDYYTTEMQLLEKKYRSYRESYWQKKKLAPSALLFFIGLNKKMHGLSHHTLFFHNDWEKNNDALFRFKKWPEKPLYYVSCATKTDPSLAPAGCDALTILIPVASGLLDTDAMNENYFAEIISDLEKQTGQPIRKHIVVKKLYSPKDFRSDYHAFKGNAYGLGQTMFQTAIFRPRNHSKKLRNLFYTGQFTVPGIGVPLVMLSGKITAQEIMRHYGN